MTNKADKEKAKDAPAPAAKPKKGLIDYKLNQPVELHSGLVRLTDEQFKRREHQVKKHGKAEGVYAIVKPFMFKAGEAFAFDGDIPKSMRAPEANQEGATDSSPDGDDTNGDGADDTATGTGDTTKDGDNSEGQGDSGSNTGKPATDAT